MNDWAKFVDFFNKSVFLIYCQICILTLYIDIILGEGFSYGLITKNYCPKTGGSVPIPGRCADRANFLKKEFSPPTQSLKIST